MKKIQISLKYNSNKPKTNKIEATPENIAFLKNIYEQNLSKKARERQAFEA